VKGGTPQKTRSSGSEAFVPVMEAADFRQGHDFAHTGRVDWSRLRRVLAPGQITVRLLINRHHRRNHRGADDDQAKDS
jgi:hypothetical protein